MFYITTILLLPRRRILSAYPQAIVPLKQLDQILYIKSDRYPSIRPWDHRGPICLPYFLPFGFETFLRTTTHLRD